MHRYLNGDNPYECQSYELGESERCGRELGAVIHYSDTAHPFSPQEPGRCGWAKLDGSGLCGNGWEWIGHALSAETQEMPVAGGKPAHVRTQEHAYEGAPEHDAHAARAGSARPHGAFAGAPDEWAQERTEVIVRDAWTANTSGVYQRAEGAAKALDLAWPVTAGPWPVRQFSLYDDTASIFDQGEAYRNCAWSLDELGKDYSVEVWRVTGEGRRVALVRWSWAMQVEREALGDELVAQHG